MMELVNALYAYKEAEKTPHAGLIYEVVSNLLKLALSVRSAYYGRTVARRNFRRRQHPRRKMAEI